MSDNDYDDDDDDEKTTPPPRLARMALRVNGARVGSVARPRVDGAATRYGRPAAEDPYAARPAAGPRRFGLRVHASRSFGAASEPGTGTGTGTGGGGEGA